MKKTNKKRALIASIAAFALVAGTYAMYVSNFKVENKFQVTAPDAKFEETFTPPLEGDTVFGNEYAKSGYVNNTGTTDVKARVKITAKWTNTVAENEPINIYDNNKSAATLIFGNANVVLNNFKQGDGIDNNYATDNGALEGDAAAKKKQWIYDDTDKYFYYGGKTDGIVPARTKSAGILQSVKFAKDLAVVDTKGYYTVVNDIETVDNDTYSADGYASQDLATKRVKALKDAGVTGVGEITFTETTTYKKAGNNKSYDNSTYVVTLEGQVISADTTWENAE